MVEMNRDGRSVVCTEILTQIPGIKILSSVSEGVWADVIANSDFKYVQYTGFWIKYQEYYQKGRCEELIPFYFVFFNEKTAVAIWPITIRKISDKYECGFLDDDIFPPLLVKNLASKTIRKLYGKCWEILSILQRYYKLESLRFIHHYLERQITLSEFQRFLCEKGAQSHLTHGAAVDMQESMETIQGNIRRSYKSLINKGKKLFEYRFFIGPEISEDVFSEVQAFHLQVAGKVTRIQKTWDTQYSWIQENHALLVCSYQGQRLIGASLFPYTEDMALYAIGIYDRKLFDQPIAHALMMEAIRFFHERGQKYLWVGLRHYKNDSWLKPDEKLQSISHFKEGFATHQSLHIHQRINF
jgi:FemAB family protein